ncbi:hypothetical protein NXC14_CH01090 [Rhizobium sp. NXC14]|nr:hypothetical protein NXC14_CH01090 [Rhizobium sp. NXC14]
MQQNSNHFPNRFKIIRPSSRAGRIWFQIATLAVLITAFGATQAILLCGEPLTTKTALKTEARSTRAPLAPRKVPAATSLH